MGMYRDWPLYETVPDGWKVDKTCGSPLHGYEFITDGKSVIRGGKRALVRIHREPDYVDLSPPVVYYESIGAANAQRRGRVRQ